jgi:hypothetical protein
MIKLFIGILIGAASVGIIFVEIWKESENR